MRRTFVAVGCLFALFVFAERAEAASPCPSGSVPPECRCATDADIAARGPEIAGKPVCPGDDRAGGLQTAGEAKRYLDSLPKRPLSRCAPPNTRNIQRLNDKFAVCAANFFKAYIARYGNIEIRSAFRDGTRGSAPDGSGRSANKCAGGVDGSNHTRGLAIDVGPPDSSQKGYDNLRDFARANPQFGVCFPRPMYRGRPDRPHMILAGIGGGESRRCARIEKITQPCAEGGAFDPNQIRPASAASPISNAPLGLGNTLRNYLSPPPPPPPPPIAQQPIAPPTQQATQAAFQPTPPATQPQPAVGPGTSPTLPDTENDYKEQQRISSLLSDTSEQTDEKETEDKDKEPTAFELLGVIAYGTSTTATATDAAQAVPVTVDINSAGGMRPMVTNFSFLDLVPDAIKAYFYDVPNPPDTFVSPDLSGNTTIYYEGPTIPPSQIEVQLERLRAFLVTLLGYLQPFGPRGLTDENGEGME